MKQKKTDTAVERAFAITPAKPGDPPFNPEDPAWKPWYEALEAKVAARLADGESVHLAVQKEVFNGHLETAKDMMEIEDVDFAETQLRMAMEMCPQIREQIAEIEAAAEAAKKNQGN